MMRGAFFNGGVTLRHDCPLPAPMPGEALVRVHLAGICATDIEILNGYADFQAIPGHEFVGVVEAVADAGGEELVGRRVVGEINIGCRGCDFCAAGLKSHCRSRLVLGLRGKDGCFADYLTLPVENLHLLPDSISDEEAVFVEPLAAALAVLPHLKAVKETEVLVLGDGKLGLLVAQILHNAGAATAISGRHPKKLALAGELGINTLPVGHRGEDKKFGFVVEATGSSAGLAEALRLVRPRGVIVLKSTVAAGVGVDLTTAVVDEITIAGSRCGPFVPALAALAEKRVTVLPLLEAVFPAEELATAMARAQAAGALKVLLDFR